MSPEAKENKEFSQWFEKWMARMQASAVHDHDPPREQAVRGAEEERRSGGQEPVGKH